VRSIAPTGVCIRAVTDGIRDWSHRTSWRPAGRSTPTGTGRSRTRRSPASTTAARSTGRSAGARRRPPSRLQDAPGVWDIDRERLSADRHGVKVAAAWSARLRARNRGRAGLRALGSDQVKSLARRPLRRRGARSNPPVARSRGGCLIVFADMPMSEITLIMLNCGRLPGYAPGLLTVGRAWGFRPFSSSATQATHCDVSAVTAT
jgi:hypothetical protein